VERGTLLPFFVLVTPVTRTKNGYQVKIEELYSRKDVPYFWSSAAVDIAIVQCTYAALPLCLGRD
jgi:hypothetical protein